MCLLLFWVLATSEVIVELPYFELPSEGRPVENILYVIA